MQQENLVAETIGSGGDSEQAPEAADHAPILHELLTFVCAALGYDTGLIVLCKEDPEFVVCRLHRCELEETAASIVTDELAESASRLLDAHLRVRSDKAQDDVGGGAGS